MIKTILWDVDRTLLDFDAAERAAIQSLFVEFGLGECSDEQVARYSVLNMKYWEKLERGEITKPQVLVGAQTKKLTRSGLGALMDGVFLSEQLGAEKPKKEFFDQVFAAIGPVEKSETMIVGDSLTSDIRGGDNAGIVTCWYNPEGIKAPEGYRIDHEIRDLHEVYGLL